MTRSMRNLLLAGNLVFTSLVAVQTEAASPISPAADASDVQKSLFAELNAETVTVNRRETLIPTIQPESASNASWWQSGYVKIGAEWRKAEISADNSSNQIMDEYRQQRGAALKTVEGQLKLANWCESHKLKVQEQAHLMQVLILSEPTADRPVIYKRLGYRQIGDQWISPADLQDLQRQSHRRDEQIREWKPTVERIARNWFANVKQRKKAQEELNRIGDSAAVPALLASTSLDESLDLAICSRLDKLPSFEASQALAAMAVQSDFETVRQAATEFLKGRRVDDFAPTLLFEMRSPFQVVSASRNGLESRLIVREEADKFLAIDVKLVSGGTFELADRNQLRNVVPASRTRPNMPIGHRFPDAASALAASTISRARANIDDARFVDAVDYEIQSRAELENDRVEELNSRSAKVLAAVTDQDASSDPRFWWAWWYMYTGTVPPPKQYKTLSTTVKLPPRIINAGVLRAHCSCLVAGTPVWTERGFLPIESIQVGDRVLAKDISTGEVDYKPVVHTTIRQPVPVKRFVVAGNAIVASEGHNFWSSGNGWTKTREITANLPIHTATGMSRVESIDSPPEHASVYNLVVAEFHTYFVGPSMVLSHDVTPPSPTNFKVPGLAAQ